LTWPWVRAAGLVAGLSAGCPGTDDDANLQTLTVVYPVLAESRIDLDIDLDGWAIVPGDPTVDNRWEKLGRPLELCFGASCREQWIDVESDGSTVHLSPHYERSSWDDFYVDAQGRISATGLGGWFPITLGNEADNRAGLVAVLRAAAQAVGKEDPGVAAALAEMADRIEAPVNSLRPARGGLQRR
jgi:hypothetical protein